MLYILYGKQISSLVPGCPSFLRWRKKCRRNLSTCWGNKPRWQKPSTSQRSQGHYQPPQAGTLEQNYIDWLMARLWSAITVHILQNGEVMSNKMVHKKRHPFLAQFSIPFHMVWSVVLLVLTSKTPMNNNDNNNNNNNNNNVFSRHLCHLRTISFMEMAAIIIAKFALAFLIWNMKCFNTAQFFVIEI